MGDWKDAAKALLFGSKLNVLLICIPIALICAAADAGNGIIFFFALASICPLAERLGFITEQLAMYTNPTVGGLLNASFGNATEVIVSIAGLRAGLLRVVQLSLLGSVLSNMLLVLGCAFLAGGTRYKEQLFNVTGVGVNITLLMLAVLAQTLPAILTASHTGLKGSRSGLALSRFTSFVMLSMYGAFLYFQLVSHKDIYDDDDESDKASDGPDGPESLEQPPAGRLSSGQDIEGGSAAEKKAEDAKKSDDDEDELVLTFKGAIACLAAVTVLIAVLSELLVDSIEGAAEAWDMPLPFISVILLPIVGNAAEHASAVIFALHNKVDLAIGIAVGSSTQIALLVMPACVLLSAAMGKPLGLDLEPFETASLLLSVLMLAFTVVGGRANWLKGAALVAAYLVLGAAYVVHDDPLLTAEHKNSG